MSASPDQPLITITEEGDALRLEVLANDATTIEEQLTTIRTFVEEKGFVVKHVVGQNILVIHKVEDTPKVWVDSLMSPQDSEQMIDSISALKRFASRSVLKPPRSERIPHMQRAGLNKFDRRHR